ncbi:site-specific integrase [Neorhizobium petrolearium]|uniref:site-specific integrase n=1 Tax=Neorhizobium petrolearium TaxID=515361 RepID=UPI003F7E74EB
MSQIPIERLNEAAKAYFQKRLNAALEISLDLRDDEMADLDLEIQLSRDRVAELRQMLKSHKFDPLVESAAEEVLSLTSALSPGPDVRRYAATLAARALLHLNNYVVEELSGNVYDGAKGDPLFSGILPTQMPAWPDEVKSEQKSLGELIERYIELKRGGWVAKTEADQRRSLSLAADIIGSTKPVVGLSTDDVRAVRDVLMQMPRNALKSAATRNKSMMDVLKGGNGGPLLSPKTRDKYFSMFRSFLAWAVSEEELKSMPGPAINVASGSKVDAIDERHPYELSHLRKIFGSPLYMGCKSLAKRAAPGDLVQKDGYYWVPLVALFTGMRLGEIVQLRVEDLRQDDGIYYFDISRDELGEKVLKTANSKRRVPVHSALISIGLLAYHEQVSSLGWKRLFDDIKPDAKGYFSGLFSKWWHRFTQKIGVHNSKLVFHSFRHTFTDALREAEVAEEVSRALVGHADKAGRRDVHMRYGSKATLKRLKQNIEKVQYPGIIELVNSKG